MIVIFTDVEAALVSAIKVSLQKVPPFTLPIHVGTVKKSAGSEWTGFQVIIRGDGGVPLDKAFREEGFGINVYGGSNSENSKLARTVEGLLVSDRSSNRKIKTIEIGMSPTRVDNPNSDEMQRYLTGVAIVGASALTLTP